MPLTGILSSPYYDKYFTIALNQLVLSIPVRWGGACENKSRPDLLGTAFLLKGHFHLSTVLYSNQWSFSFREIKNLYIVGDLNLSGSFC